MDGMVVSRCSNMSEAIDRVDPKQEKSPNKEAAKHEGGVFLCYKCKLEETYHYKGQVPPFCRAIKVSEDSYVARDPFTPPSERSFLLLGSDCSMCSKPVCQDCSLFYAKRFCLPCAQENIKNFPSALHSKIQQRKT